MHKRITFRGMEHSDPMEQHANEKLAKVEEFLVGNERSPIYIDLVFAPSKVHAHHRVELRVKSPNYEKYCDYEGSQFYDVLDHVIDTMYKELHEEKQKQHDKLKSVGRHDDFKKQR